MDIEKLASWVAVIVFASSIFIFIWKRVKEPLRDLWFNIEIKIKKRFFPKPINITKTNVIMGGRCQENLEGCISPAGEKPITQVVISDKCRKNVCSVCLEKNIHEHKWKISGD